MKEMNSPKAKLNKPPEQTEIKSPKQKLNKQSEHLEMRSPKPKIVKQNSDAENRDEDYERNSQQVSQSPPPIQQSSCLRDTSKSRLKRLGALYSGMHFILFSFFYN